MSRSSPSLCESAVILRTPHSCPNDNRNRYLLRASFKLVITRQLSGEDIRNDIIHYMLSAPLRFDEFAMIHEVCNFDANLGFLAKKTIMTHKLEGGVPEMARIEEYAKKYGLWNEMMRIEEKSAVRLAWDRKVRAWKKAGVGKIDREVKARLKAQVD